MFSTSATEKEEAEPFIDVDSNTPVDEKEKLQTPPPSTEAAAGNRQKLAFQAETRQILNIMAKSLYTDKEVFLRELISNASDALEKLRFMQRSQDVTDNSANLEIHITIDKEKNILVIQDSGVGMTSAELVENLGTIARSGSKAFVQALNQNSASGEVGKVSSGGAETNIIGQFGVGFYSIFMVADRVEVFSRHAGEQTNLSHYWTSDGSGEYELAEATGVPRGTKVILHLREDAKNFLEDIAVETIVKKYSNFVGFPIYLNGKKINTMAAIWTKSASDVSESEHQEFYRYLSGAWDDPLMHLQFATDVPLSIKALFYVPKTHSEKFGMGRMEPGVGLYSRKVLIQGKCKTILPDWMRFVKGVVDSEDIPLNISRENMQDSSLISRIKNVLTRKLLRFLEDKAKHDPDAYATFFEEFGMFIKEGVCTDFYNKDNIAKLLRFESSTHDAGKLVSLDDYISRMFPEQKGIYFLVAPNRQSALSSPYFEAFQSKGTEVLLLYQDIDDFVMRNLETYNKRKLISIESAAASGADRESPAKTEEAADKDAALSGQEAAELVSFLQSVLSDRVSSVKITERLTTSPAIVVDHESSAVRKMMKYVDQKHSHELPKQKIEINPKHAVMKGILQASRIDPVLATLAAEQVYDNVLMAADILDNPRSMLPRLNRLLEQSLRVVKHPQAAPAAPKSENQ